MIIEDKRLHNKYHIFKNRRNAGFSLGSFLALENFDIIYIIPNGGVPVALGLLEFPLIHVNKLIDLLIIRKIQIPGNPEAGMGAVTPDGQIFLNEELIDHLSVSNYELEQQIERTKQQIEKRKREYNIKSLSTSLVYGKNVLLIDDGIATGYSMLAGTKWLKKLGAEVLIAIPTAPVSSIRYLESFVEKIFCLNIRDKYPFAVADAYQDWYDLDFAETKYFLNEIEILKELS